jgi:hypothetical protein
MSVQPIKPTDISPNLENIIPDVVIQAVNALLKDKYTGGKSAVTFKQDELINKVIGLDSSISRNQIFDKKMFDFEKLYEKNGWVVEYHKPDRDESFDIYFKFKPKGN